MYLMICKPGEPERLRAYGKMPGLREMQQIVGGHLEVVTPDGFPDGVRLVLNEDGKGLGLHVNRWVSIGGRRDLIVGTCFFCAVRENEDGEQDLALLDREQADAVVRAMGQDEIRSTIPPRQKCCLCGNLFSGKGNNAAPLAAGRCCDLCYELRVGPELLKKKLVRAEQTIGQQLEDIAAEICDKYCKYMVTAQGEDDLERHCDRCPLVRLV